MREEEEEEEEVIDPIHIISSCEVGSNYRSRSCCWTSRGQERDGAIITFL